MNIFSTKIRTLFGAAVLALSLAACGGDSGTGGNNEIELSSSSSEITLSSSSHTDVSDPLSSSSLQENSSSSATDNSSSSTAESSSSATPESSSSDVNLSSSGGAIKEYGEFNDTRDSKVYRYVKIGSQTWMAENLNYYKYPSWCYDDLESNCGTYGRLYDWNTAMEVCPEGWHLPSYEEWKTLVDYVGGASVAGTALKLAGTDDYGFSALLSGYRNYFSFLSVDVGHYGFWWTATENGSDDAYYRSMGSGYANVGEYYYDKNGGFSVRCVKD
ncbi:MAG: fibrobacter succinogenes major paralogous domain-containing protein [Fibrobacter sp.]|jgi:uncharacterized protein (TIGR02145 family)|nr:fibrobacter succinogenes major paralogous domain-containing protein [Fibrobacter sp.]